MTTTLGESAAISEDDQLRQQSKPRALTFTLTWIAYASYYFGRKGISVVKSTLQDRLHISTTTLGWIDTGFLAAYAIGQFTNGALGDKIGARKLIGFGMLAAAGACAAFGASNTSAAFLIAFILNGYFQSTGWPGCVKAMGQWFTVKERGTVMGVWSTCYQAGGLLATAFATWCLIHFGWRSAFFYPAILIAIVGLLNLALLPTRRNSSEFTPSTGTPGGAEIARWEGRGGGSRDNVQLFKSPILWSLGAAYFCLKLIRYSILFWLPFYLDKQLHYTTAQAGYQSTSFEIGGILGAIVVGYLSDRYFPGRRRAISAIMLAALAAALLLYTRLAPISQMLNFVGMALVGFCLFGPDTIIAGAAAQDLGGKHDVAKAAGFIDGLGSIGAIFQGIVTSKVSQHFGWNALFYVFVALALLGALALSLGKRSAPNN